MVYTTVSARIVDDDLNKWLSCWIAELSLPVFSYAPTRGIWASLLARTAGYGNSLSLTTSLTGYRVSRSLTLFDRKIRDTYYRDRDILVAAWEKTSRGKDHIVIPLLGPWSLVANLELANGHRVLEDRGARRDIILANLQGIADERKIIAQLLGIPEKSVLFSVSEPDIDSILSGTLSGQTSLETIAAIPKETIYQCWSDCYDIWGENTLFAIPSFATLDVKLKLILELSQFSRIAANAKTGDYDAIATWLDHANQIMCSVEINSPAESVATHLAKIFSDIGMRKAIPELLFAVKTQPTVKSARFLENVISALIEKMDAE